MTSGWDTARRRIERLPVAEDLSAFRVDAVRELRRVLPFDHYAWLLTDPETCVGAAPLAQVPELAELPVLIRAKYLTTVNRWTALEPGAAGTLSASTGGELSRSLLWRDLLHRYDVVDVLSVVFRDQHGCWGFLDLWRIGGVNGTFSTSEAAFLGDVSTGITARLRTGQAATFVGTGTAAPPVPVPDPGPAVLLLGADLRLVGQTPGTDQHLRTLLPPDGDARPIPAAAFNVAAQLLAAEAGVDQHPPAARVHLAGGRWLTFRAARLPDDGPDGLIAVTIELTPSIERCAVFASACCLSRRETELLGLMLSGRDTRELAATMFISEHTVQDHLKSMFRKTDTTTRGALVARALGV